MMMSREQETEFRKRVLFVILLLIVFKTHGVIQKLYAEDIPQIRA